MDISFKNESSINFTFFTAIYKSDLSKSTLDKINSSLDSVLQKSLFEAPLNLNIDDGFTIIKASSLGAPIINRSFKFTEEIYHSSNDVFYSGYSTFTGSIIVPLNFEYSYKYKTYYTNSTVNSLLF